MVAFSKRSSSARRARALPAFVMGAVLGVGLLSGTPAPRATLAAGPAAKSGAATGGSLGSLSREFRALVDRVSPAVVRIATTALGPAPGSTASEAALGVQERGGSGVLVSADGYIVTNAHVVEGARRLEIVLARPAAAGAPGKSIVKGVSERVEGRIVGIDAETDLALIKVERSGLPFLDLGDSDDLGEGDIVLAFGSPFGFENSVSMGVVSALGRQLKPGDPMVYIQTDTPINPGNSGGPLVNAEGRVVGINTLIFSRSGGSEGIGFAAPSNIVKSVYAQLRSRGRVSRGAIGVIAQSITPTLAAGLKLPQTWGVILSDVHPRSPAAAAGLLAGDIVLALDGKTMENGRQFDVNLYRRAAGDSATITALREGRRFVVRVPVIAREDDPARIAELVKSERSLVPRLAVLAVDIEENILPMLPWLRQRYGVLVVARAADTRQVDTGLQSGDVIHTLNDRPVTDLDALNTLLKSLRPGDPVVLDVDREGRRLYLAFEAE
jgi:serine protease Do